MVSGPVNYDDDPRATGRESTAGGARDRAVARKAAVRRGQGSRQTGDLRRGGRAPAARPSPAAGRTGGQPRKDGKPGKDRKPGKPRKGGRAGTGGGGRRGGVPPAVFYLTAAVLAVVLLAGVAYLVIGRGSDARPTPRSARPASSGSAPAVYSDAPSTPTFDPIGDRSADGAPLTADEVFPRGKTTLTDGVTHARLELRGQRVDTDCAQAVWGAAVGTVLRKSECTQAVRGMYADEKKGYAALVAIFNLAHAVDAGRFVHAITPGSGAGFVRPLQQPAPLQAFGQGFGMARGAAMGHYAVVVWVQRIDGTGDAKDQALISLLVTAGDTPAVYGRVAAQH